VHDKKVSETEAMENSPDKAVTHPWTRYVAMGDSFTEGIGDPEPASPGGYRGWADRVAEELSRGHEDFAYANLAVRGRLLQQIVDQQLAHCLSLRPDLVTLSAGGNDLIRPGGDPDALAEKLDSVVQILSLAGATVVLFNGPDTGSSVLGRVRSKVAIYNENLRTVAARHDAVIADMWSLRQLNDPQMWDADRLHFSPLGHHTIAAVVLDSLNVEHTLEPLSPKPLPQRSWREARTGDLIWAREHFVPWVVRRLRHRSSGDGITAKRPLAGPVFGPGVPLGSGEGPPGAEDALRP
jgi:lysophospholipase L1-like esterase